MLRRRTAHVHIDCMQNTTRASSGRADEFHFCFARAQFAGVRVSSPNATTAARPPQQHKIDERLITSKAAIRLALRSNVLLKALLTAQYNA